MEYTVHHVKFRLSSDRSWIERALVVLYKQQTPEERDAKATTEANGRGFNYQDSAILTSFAEQLINNWDYHLSDRQMSIAQDRLPKYAKQLISIISKPSKHNESSNETNNHGLYGLGEIF